MRYLLVFNLESGEIVGHQAQPCSAVSDIAQGMGCREVADIDDWERAIRIGASGLELAPEPVRHDPSRMQPTREDLLQRNGHYDENRRQSYDPLPEQIDRITKALAYLKAAGVDIGEAGIEQVEHCQAVKAKYPKRVL